MKPEQIRKVSDIIADMQTEEACCNPDLVGEASVALEHAKDMLRVCCRILAKKPSMEAKEAMDRCLDLKLIL